MKTFLTMAKVEWKLSLRAMDMMIFAIAMPVVITVIIGIIYGEDIASKGADYTFFAQSFGALTTIGICAAGLMGLPLVIADYRHKKILKRYKVTPVSPVMLLAVQVVVHAIQSLISLVLIYIVSVLLFGYQMNGSIILFIISYLFVLIAIYSIGMMVAGIAPNVKSANIICMLLYFPMLIFSGATLPYEVMPKGLQAVANIMPLTQGIKLLKTVALGMPLTHSLSSIVILIVISIICVGISLRYFKWE